MTRSHVLRRLARRLVVGALAASGLAVIATSTADAGGWAVTTLDAIPTPRVAETVDVGFTIRQHGVRPVALDEGVAIEVTAANGAVAVFPAGPHGDVGHYVARVTFPTAGTYDWTVHQGWFGEQDLGAVSIAGGSADHRFPAAVRDGLPSLAVALATFAVADAAAGRRRRRADAL